MMANPFDQFDSSASVPFTGNPFDQFDRAPTRITVRPQGGPVREVGGSVGGVAQGGTATASNINQGTAFGVSALQGLTFNFGDEIAGGLSALAGQGYERGRDAMRGLTKEAKEQYPKTALAGEIGGSLLIPGGAILQAATLPGRIVRGAVAGSAYGGLSGLGEGESTSDRLSRGATGAAIGLGVGAAAPPVIGGLVRGGGALISPLTTALRGSTSAGAEREASRRVVGAIERDIASDPNAVSRLRPGEYTAARTEGQPVTVMDLGGETTRGLARSAANTSTEGRAALGRTIDDRFEGQSGRVTDWFRHTFHFPDADAQQRAIQQTAQTVNRPAYARAYSDPHAQSMWDEGFQQLTAAPIVQDAIRGAARTGANKAAVEGFRPPRNPFTFAEDGTMTLQPGVTPSLQFWDSVKRNLDDRISSLTRSGEREAARDAQQLRTALVNHLDELVPTYSQARSGAAHFFRSENALEAGQNYVMQNFANAETRRALGQMSPTERQLFQDGFVSRFIETLDKTGDRRNILNQISSNPAAREKLTIALGPQRAAELEARLRVEGIMDLARRATQGNSTTARQLAELGFAGGAGSIGAYGTYNLDPAQMTTAAVMGALLAGRRGIDQRVSRRVAELLTSNDPTLLQRGIQMIARNERMMNALRSTDIRLARVGTQQGAPSAMQGPVTSRAEGEQPQPQGGVY